MNSNSLNQNSISDEDSSDLKVLSGGGLDAPKDPCPLCLEYEEDCGLMQTTKCGHKFCVDCITQVNSFDCPMCRRNIRKSLTTKQQNIIQRRITKSKCIEHQENNITFDSFMTLALIMVNSVNTMIVQDDIILEFPRVNNNDDDWIVLTLNRI